MFLFCVIGRVLESLGCGSLVPECIHQQSPYLNCVYDIDHCTTTFGPRSSTQHMTATSSIHTLIMCDVFLLQVIGQLHHLVALLLLVLVLLLQP